MQKATANFAFQKFGMVIVKNIMDILPSVEWTFCKYFYWNAYFLPISREIWVPFTP
jgi:hypothetical protein